MDKRAILNIPGTVQGPNKWHVTDGLPLQRPRYAPHPSYACTAPLFTSPKISVSQKTKDVIQYHPVKKPCFLSCWSKSIMSRENLHVSEYFVNLWEICILVKKRYYSSFASRSDSDLFKLLPKSVDRFIAFYKVYKLFCWRQNSFYLKKQVLIPCSSDRCEIVLNGGKITQQRMVINKLDL